MFLILGAVALVIDKWLHLHGRSTDSSYISDRSSAEKKGLLPSASTSRPQQCDIALWFTVWTKPFVHHGAIIFYILNYWEVETLGFGYLVKQYPRSNDHRQLFLSLHLYKTIQIIHPLSELLKAIVVCLSNRKEEVVSEDQELFNMMDQRDSVVFLRKEINEGPTTTAFLSKIVHDHDKDTLWRLLQEAKNEHELSPVANTLGGKFFKVCFTIMNIAVKCTRALQKRANWPPYLGGWLQKIKQYKNREDVLQQTEGCSRDIPQMREYQKRAVEIAMDGWDPWTKYKNENYLFVAPTGSGKTRIFIECSR